MSRGDVKQRIIEAAGPIFAAKGFEKATIREICRKAGVNIAAVNYYFGSKEQLYLATIAAAHPMGQEKSQFRVDWTPNTPPERKLFQFIRQLVNRILENESVPWQLQLMLRELIQPTAFCREFMRDVFRRAFSQLEQIVRELVGDRVPDHRRHQICLSIIAQCVHYRMARKILPLLFSAEELAQHFDADSLAKHITEFSLAALGYRLPLGRHPSDASNTGQIEVFQAEGGTN